MKLGATVINRFIQIVQEGFLTGVDVSDLLLQMDVEVQDQKVELTTEYVKQVKDGHDRMLDNATQLQKQL